MIGLEELDSHLELAEEKVQLVRKWADTNPRDAMNLQSARNVAPEALDNTQQGG